MTVREIYLDAAATTAPLPCVAAAMSMALSEGWGNASSPHGRGRAARHQIEEARETIAHFLCTDALRVVLTSGATEGNDAVLRWALEQPDLRLVTTGAEHASLLGVFRRVPERVAIVPVDPDGLVDLSRLAELARDPRPSLFAFGWANGETGVVQPMRAIRGLVDRPGHHLLVDGAQAVGRLPRAAFEGLEADYLTVSAHKMNGPQGIGCLVLGSGTPIPPLAAGGGQEDGRRSGTENLPGTVGFAAACDERGRTLEADLNRMAHLRDLLETRVLARLPFAAINGARGQRSATTTSLTIAGVDGAALVARLDALGLRCSQVSACSGARPEPSRTLLSMGRDEETAFSSIRFAVSITTTEAEVDLAAALVVQEATLLRQIMGAAA